MPNIESPLRRPAAGILAILAVASLGLTACGGSSGKASKSTNAAATNGAGSTTSNTGSATTGSSQGSSTTGSSKQSGTAQTSRSGRFGGLRECLQKDGITLPKPTAGAGGSQGGGLFLGARGQLPKGVTRTQYQAALRKCLGGSVPGGQASRGVNSPVLRQGFAKFATCLRQNGVNIPPPNTSGRGPIFSTKGLNTTSPQFRAATAKCRGVLLGAFRGISNAARGTRGRPPVGAPPAASEGSSSG
jgi:hypothetical protein